MLVLNMPCPDCHKQTVPVNPQMAGSALNFFLDQAELDLQAAWVNDVPDEARSILEQLIQVIQKMKAPYKVPLEMKLAKFLQLSYKVGNDIPCCKCRMAWIQEISRSIEVRHRLERRDRRGAAWVYVKKTFWGFIWLLRALPVLFHRK